MYMDCAFEVRVFLFANDGYFSVENACPMVFWTNWTIEMLASRAHKLLYVTSLAPVRNGSDDIKVFYENGARVYDVKHVQQNSCLVVGSGDFVAFRYKEPTKQHGEIKWKTTPFESFLSGLVEANHRNEAQQMTEPNKSRTVMNNILQNLENFLYTEHDIWVASQQAKGIELTPEEINPPRPNKRSTVSPGSESDGSSVQVMYPSIVEWVEDNCITPRSSFSANNDNGFGSATDGDIPVHSSPRKEQNKSKIVGNVTLPRMDLVKRVEKMSSANLARTISSASSSRISKSGTKDRTADKLWRSRVSDQLKELKQSIPELAAKKRSTKTAIFSSAKDYILSMTEENKKLETEIAMKKSELMAFGQADTFATNTGVLIVEQRLDMIEQGPIIIYADHHWKMMSGNAAPEGRRMMELCGTDNNPFMYSACKVMNKTLFDSRELHWSGVMLCLRSDKIIMGCNSTIEPVKLEQESSTDDEGITKGTSDVVRSVILTKDWHEFNISDSIGSHLSPHVVEFSCPNSTSEKKCSEVKRSVDKVAVRC
ncbi:hypothetical protein, variant [Sphaeroforma arctica JP610]|uniref:BHLH domain-containing protein n=1 Tax=Sphaeroforma arctica JP610 TaxID=667725 RepID=A0A0L0FT18_9EUKA|nr:hypothetical protein, variant [Sphaeroforma arctica JP610]KNC79962.1 hypothetical protein, variant [Sphaeroforma arctica JP610]|eukprot:XP_014153864.1 hypothetical protein, variant [Sphaeroforma arctica JP610]